MKKYWELIKNYPTKFLLISVLLQIKRTIWQEKIKNSYSQNYEDLTIDKLFNNKNTGRYLEIGAYHPKRLSNTYRLYKKGWTGVVVEPNPEVKNLFDKIRPKDQFLNIGISEKGGQLKYYKYLIPALNSFVKTENGHKIISIEKIETKKISDVVDENFDFVSIDTEGFDEMILKNWPWKICRPKVICVEGNTERMLEKQGYKLFYKNKFNSIYYF